MATASTMTIFCLRCGHENAGENRFCGMCGAVLLRPRSMGSQSGARGPQAEPIPPQSVREPQEGFSAQPSQAGYSVPPSASTSPPAPQPQIPVPPRPREWPKSQVGRESPISGPSFLGLDSTTDRDPDYLLDEVPPTSHWRLYLALALDRTTLRSRPTATQGQAGSQAQKGSPPTEADAAFNEPGDSLAQSRDHLVCWTEAEDGSGDWHSLVAWRWGGSTAHPLGPLA